MTNSQLPDLVVAHYDEGLEWLKEVSALCRPVVYTKGNPNPKYTGSCLPNVGREAHTYLTYIVRHYDDMPEWVVFTQGDPFPHLPAGVTLASLLTPQPGKFVTPWSLTSADWGEDGHLDWMRFKTLQVQAQLAGRIRRARLPFPEWLRQATGHDLTREGTVTYGPGAIFAVSKQAIRSRPLQHYKDLLADLDHPMPEEAHYFERGWWYLFGGELKALTQFASPDGLSSGRLVDAGSYGVVYCAHPSYGPGHKASHRAFWSQAVHPHDPYAAVETVMDDHGSSLLASAFNYHWTNALNMQLMGKPISRFVMLHDDIVPRPNWLGVGLAELDGTGCDVLSALVPLKDSRALTSTALDDPDDPWEVYRRLSLRDAKNLPETFTAEDCEKAGLTGQRRKMVDGPYEQLRALLPNTGLWFCRFDRDWRFKVHFNIKDTIQFRLAEDYPPNADQRQGGDSPRWKAGEIIPNSHYRPGMVGQFVARVMSEDWDFGRQLARLGCDVRVTRKVKLLHLGSELPFNNYDLDWGEWATDQSLARKWDPSPYDDVAGWLNADEGRFLRELARGNRVLEIGSYCGKSTLWMAETAEHILCVDTFDGRGTTSPRDTYQEFCENVKKFNAGEKVEAFRGTSTDCLSLFSPYICGPALTFDVAFIDGAHDRPSVEEDARVAAALLKPEGVMCFHDYGTHDGVTGAVNHLLSTGYRRLGAGGSMIVVGLPEEVAAPKPPANGVSKDNASLAGSR